MAKVAQARRALTEVEELRTALAGLRAENARLRAELARLKPAKRSGHAER